MLCPRCSAPADKAALDCPSCGIIFAKWRAPGRAPLRPAENLEPVMEATAAPAVPETLGITHTGWRSAAAGFAMACILAYFPFLSFILSPLTTLVHELGHTAVLWLFGFSAIPAFDFSNGGGVTMSDLDRTPSIVGAWVLGLAGLLWWQRERKPVVAALITAAVVYFFTYNTTGETLAITLGGHGGEIVFGVLFLYRGLTGWGCKVEAERPLYAFLAFMILFSGIRLGTSLMSNSPEKYLYLQGKGGIDHDLVTGAQIMSMRLESLARLLVGLELLAIPAAFLAASKRRMIGAVSEAEGGDWSV